MGDPEEGGLSVVAFVGVCVCVWCGWVWMGGGRDGKGMKLYTEDNQAGAMFAAGSYQLGRVIDNRGEAGVVCCLLRASRGTGDGPTGR